MEKMDFDNESETEAEAPMEKMDIDESGVSINITAAIYGHGGLPQHNKMPVVFPPPPKNVTLNLLGFAPAGVCNIVSKQYETYIDYLMTTDPTKVTPQLLTAEYKKNAHNYKWSNPIINRYPTLSPESGVDLFTYFKNYGRQKKARTDKIYTGANNEDIRRNSRIDGLTTSGPLLKIYSIIIKDNDGNVLMSNNTVESITLSNNILLSQILSFIADKIKYQSTTVIGSKSYKINIDLFDDTCNYTENPNIAFLDSPSLKGRVKVEKGGKAKTCKQNRHKKRKTCKQNKHKKRKTCKQNKKGKKNMFSKALNIKLKK